MPYYLKMPCVHTSIYINARDQKEAIRQAKRLVRKFGPTTSFPGTVYCAYLYKFDDDKTPVWTMKLETR
jgi:hypothetical protein